MLKKVNNLKKTYAAPEIMFEEYQLDASIAGNCTLTVKVGPEAPGHTQCDGYDGPYSKSAIASQTIENVTFYEYCDCYTTGGDVGYWTS